MCTAAVFWRNKRVNSVRPPASIRDPACIRTTRFTNEHVFKTPRLLVLYLLLQSEIPGDVQSAQWYSPLDPRLLLETRLV